MAGRRAWAAAAVLCCLLAVAAGCGDDGSATESAAADYHLDPPDLATLLVDELEPGVPVLCYHYFRHDFNPGYLAKVVGSLLFGMPALGDREFWTTPHAEFEKHLRWFRDTGTRVMTLDEVADLVERREPLPPRAVVLTIDDADRTVYEIAWPLLQEYGVQAHLFVPTVKVGTDWSSLEVCSWEELREMAASGAILVESHTRDLHYKIRTRAGLEPVFWHPGSIDVERRHELIGELSGRWEELAGMGVDEAPAALLGGVTAAVAADLLASRLDVLDGVGRAPRWLAWPYGFANDRLDSLSRHAGFRGTVSLHPSVVTERDTSMALGRVTLTAKSTLGQIADIFAVTAR